MYRPIYKTGDELMLRCSACNKSCKADPERYRHIKAVRNYDSSMRRTAGVYVDYEDRNGRKSLNSQLNANCLMKVRDVVQT